MYYNNNIVYNPFFGLDDTQSGNRHNITLTIGTYYPTSSQESFVTIDTITKTMTGTIPAQVGIQIPKIKCIVGILMPHF